MSNEKKQILEMLSSGKITVEEAENLLSAVGEESTTSAGGKKTMKDIKFLRISVDSKDADGDKVNIKIPIKFVKAGLKLTAFLPENAYGKVNHALKENGFPLDLRAMKEADFSELVEALAEMDIEVQDKDGEQVRIFCE